ncbi:MAG: hypothetical protein A3K09_07220 [Nitrospinae bacterium RIFCSPLOWO2_12_FULL_47_7]|nr:MAG: hypothetical protein A3K09_07220 [Nitrospinae bacterium RIFCSPLOWO2_12_FULL_47_7]
MKESNILLAGPRRMGKTSVMFHLLDFPCDNFLVVYLNAETLSTPADFIIHLILALRAAQPQYFFEQLKIVDYENILASAPGDLEPKEALKAGMNWGDAWEARASQLIGRIRTVNQSILLVIDELPDLFLNIQKKIPEQFEPFLRWFRAAREVSNSPIRWIAGGSASLVCTLDETGQTEWINDFYHLVLPPFTLKEAENFVLKVFSQRGVRFDARVIPRMQELLGKAIPFFLQVMVRELVDRWRLKEEKPLTAEVVDEVFERDLLGIRMLGHLQHFHSRIELRYPEIEREAVYGLLKQLSLKNGVGLKDLFASYMKFESKRAKPRNEKQLMRSFGRLLKFLQIDFYVEDIGGKRYDFASQLLKLWWKKYHAVQ